MSPGFPARPRRWMHLVDLREQNHSFADMAGYFAFYGVGDKVLGGQGEPERLSSVPVSRISFRCWGSSRVRAASSPPRNANGTGRRPCCLSHGFWQRRFASDPAIVGRPLTIDNDPVTVAGVLPESFDFSSIFAPGSHIDLFAPFPLTAETNRWGNTMAIVGRLKPGVSTDQRGAGGGQAPGRPDHASASRTQRFRRPCDSARRTCQRTDAAWRCWCWRARSAW